MKNKRRLLALFLFNRKPASFYFTTKNNAKVDAHGYVHTYPGSFLALWLGVSFGWLYIPAWVSGKAYSVVMVSLAGTTIERMCKVQILTSFRINLPESSRGESAIPLNRYEGD